LRVYPNHYWEPWKFVNTSSVMNRDPSVITQAIAYAEKELRITEPEQWYSVSNMDLENLGLFSIFDLKRKTIYEFLKKNKPEFDWKESNFAGVAFFGHTHLGAFLREIFPHFEVLSRDSTNREDLAKDFSFLILPLRLAFDYQTVSDYDLSGTKGKVMVELKVNPVKADICKRNGLDLVSIPFWWDRDLHSLVATIISTRPEILNSMALTAQESYSESWAPIPTSTVTTLSLWRGRPNA
jgi:hypothetical protein